MSNATHRHHHHHQKSTPPNYKTNQSKNSPTSQTTARPHLTFAAVRRKSRKPSPNQQRSRHSQPAPESPHPAAAFNQRESPRHCIRGRRPEKSRDTQPQWSCLGSLHPQEPPQQPSATHRQPQASRVRSANIHQQSPSPQHQEEPAQSAAHKVRQNTPSKQRQPPGPRGGGTQARPCPEFSSRKAGLLPLTKA
jgi:hypothetical protein